MKPTLVLPLALAMTTSACGSKSGTSTDSPGAAVGSASDPDPSTSTVAAKPSSADLTTNAQTQAQVAQSGLDSAAAAAAAGGGGTGGASLTLGDSPTGAQPKESVAKGAVGRDCYLGSTVTARASGATPAWPESTDTASIFSYAKPDPTTTTNLYVSPLVTQYPQTSPTATLTIAPFTLANLVEVIQKDNRTTSISLNDNAKTAINTSSNNEEHRFWVAKSGALTCGPAVGTAATGASGSANGTWAKVKWSDNTQVNGLQLLSLFTTSGSSTKQYLPKKKGVLQSTAVTLSSSGSSSGQRLVSWSVSSASASTVTSAAYVRQKTVTHVVNRVDQTVDGSGKVMSDLSHKDEIRATDPLVVQSYFDSSDNRLAEIIQSGTVVKTASDSSGNPTWFATLQYKGLTFDLANSTETCIPVAGTTTMTVYDKEGGSQKSQVKITYSSTANAAGGGKVDPQIAVDGDDADSSKAKWMMLYVNRKCDLK